MSSSLTVQLTDALRKCVDERRQDVQDRAVALNVLDGLGDLRQGRFSDKSILDFKDQD